MDFKKRLYQYKIYKDEDIKGKSGIYQIRNFINGKIYIGSAVNLYRRKYEHLYDLSSSTHHNIHLQRAFDKYGEQNFVFEIIEFCEPDVRYEIEQYWLDNFFGKDFCYNKNPKADKPPVVNKRKIYCVELNKDFESIEQASKELNLNPPNINIALKDIYKTSGGYHFLYEEDKSKFSKEELDILIKYKNKNFRPIICLDDNNIYYNMEDICLKYNIKYPECIIRCCRNKNKTANMYHFMYLEDFKKTTPEEIKLKVSYINNNRKIYCSTTDEMFDSMTEACKKYNLHYSGIIKCCKKEISNTKGYVFEYIT